MAKRKKRFQFESLQDNESIQALLKAITTGIGKGRLTFSDEDEKIVMKPTGMLDLKIAAAQEQDRSRFTIKVSWQDENDRVKNGKTLQVK